jgi:hypothetical protein
MDLRELGLKVVEDKISVYDDSYYSKIFVEDISYIAFDAIGLALFNNKKALLDFFENRVLSISNKPWDTESKPYYNFLESKVSKILMDLNEIYFDENTDKYYHVKPELILEA